MACLNEGQGGGVIERLRRACCERRQVGPCAVQRTCHTCVQFEVLMTTGGQTDISGVAAASSFPPLGIPANPSR